MISTLVGYVQIRYGIKCKVNNSASQGKPPREALIVWGWRMGNVVKLFHGRATAGKKIPKPVECKDCGDPIEAARLQAFNDGLAVTRCISCARAHEKRFDREMAAVRRWQSVQVLR